MITDLLLPHDAHLVLQLPLSQSSHPDCMMWIYTDNEAYIMHSGCNVARTDLERVLHDVSLRSPIWATLWKTELQPKVKFFEWHLIHLILPSVDNLARRSLQVQNICCLCNNGPDTLEHIFFTCQFANSICSNVLPDVIN